MSKWYRRENKAQCFAELKNKRQIICPHKNIFQALLQCRACSASISLHPSPRSPGKLAHIYKVKQSRELWLDDFK